MYAEISGIGNEESFRTISLSNGTNTNRVSILYNTTEDVISYYVRNTSGVLLSDSDSVADIKDVVKVAIKYKSTDFSVWLNGVEVATSVSVGDFSSNNLTELSFNSGSADPFYGKVKSLQVYTTALSDAELTNLTKI